MCFSSFRSYFKISWRRRDPKYVVATVIEQGGGGSAVAAPVGAKVMEAVMAADAGSNDASSMGRIAGSSGRQIEGFSTKSASRSD